MNSRKLYYLIRTVHPPLDHSSLDLELLAERGGRLIVGHVDVRRDGRCRVWKDKLWKRYDSSQRQSDVGNDGVTSSDRRLYFFYLHPLTRIDETFLRFCSELAPKNHPLHLAS